MKKYNVNLFYSGYILYEVEAEDEDEALEKAEELAEYDPVCVEELSRWPDHDEIEEV